MTILGNLNRMDFVSARFMKAINPWLLQDICINRNRFVSYETHQLPMVENVRNNWSDRANGSFGAILFRVKKGHTMTVKIPNYCKMLRESLAPARISRWHLEDMVPTTCYHILYCYRPDKEIFLGRLISDRLDIAWPPCSPILTPCDFFMGLPCLLSVNIIRQTWATQNGHYLASLKTKMNES